MARGENFYDARSGTLDPAAYVDCGLFAREQETIFENSLQLAGAADWLERPGDYLTLSLGNLSVLVMRTDRDELLVAENRCPGIGGKVLARDTRGRAERFVCSCHGYTFDEDLMRSALRTGHACVDRGLVFVTMADKEAASFGMDTGFGWYWDRILENSAPQLSVAGSEPLVWEFAGNWKFAAQAYAGDALRHILEERTAGLLDIAPRWTPQGAFQASGGAGAALIADDDLDGGTAPRVITATFFPNLSYDGCTQTLHVWNPLSATRTQVRSYCLAPTDANEQQRHDALRRMSMHFGPTGLVSMDEAHCWQAMSKQAQERRRPYMLDTRNTALARNLPGRLADGHSDANQHAFLGWWQSMINGGHDADFPAKQSDLCHAL